MRRIVSSVAWMFITKMRSPSFEEVEVCVPWFYGTEANDLNRCFHAWQGSTWDGGYSKYVGDPRPQKSSQTWVNLDLYDGYMIAKDGHGSTYWTEAATTSCEAGGPVTRALAMSKAVHWTTKGVE